MITTTATAIEKMWLATDENRSVHLFWHKPVRTKVGIRKFWYDATTPTMEPIKVTPEMLTELNVYTNFCPMWVSEPVLVKVHIAIQLER